jgi:hypothetical protein
MRFTFWNSTSPIMISTGLVPAAGMCLNKGLKKDATRKRSPHTTVLRPVLAPSLIAAADSGETRMGAVVSSPPQTVKKPDRMKIQRPRGIELSPLVSTARLLSDVSRPLR